MCYHYVKETNFPKGYRTVIFSIFDQNNELEGGKIKGMRHPLLNLPSLAVLFYCNSKCCECFLFKYVNVPEVDAIANQSAKQLISSLQVFTSFGHCKIAPHFQTFQNNHVQT